MTGPLARLAARRGSPRLRWALNVAAPDTIQGAMWGDVHFVEALAAALVRLGQDSVIRRHGEHTTADRRGCDVSLTLRGLDRVAPLPGAVNMLWVISHPDLVDDAELADHDVVAAASVPWARRAGGRTGRTVHVVHQATDPVRFAPADDVVPECAALFVGVRPQRRERPVVTAAVASGVDLAVYGRGWAGRLPPGVFRGDYLPNERLGAAYRRTGVVLNDHWSDMAAEGFLNNRLFDATAAGARVVSDRVEGIAELFGGVVQVFDDAADVARLLGPERDTAFPDRAERLRVAARVRDEHSFDARARQLLDLALAERRSPGRLVRRATGRVLNRT